MRVLRMKLQRLRLGQTETGQERKCEKYLHRSEILDPVKIQ
jgi:hypothetical protein